MDIRIAHDAAAADPLAARLELRLDQRGDGRLFGELRRHRRQDQPQTDEADIDGGQTRRGPDRARGKGADVGALQTGHPWVGAQGGVELVAADIDGVDMGGIPPQQHVGEAAGRSADIEAGQAGGVEAEGVERRRELETAAGDVGVGGRGLDPRIRADRVRGTCDEAAVGPDQAGLDRRPRLRPAAEMPVLDQEPVGPQPLARHRISLPENARPRHGVRDGAARPLSEGAASRYLQHRPGRGVPARPNRACPIRRPR